MRKRMWAFIAVLAIAAVYPAAGVSRGHGGTLNLIAWEGYTQPQWVKPFVKNTGCAVHAKYAGTSDEMVALMRSGGGSQYDLVSASGDASLRLIYGKDVQPIDTSKIPDFKNFGKAFQSPPNNTVGGKHYGVSLQWGPNLLLYNTQKVKPAPTSWASIYDSKYKGKITVPDNPIQIADAALYLKSSQPSLGIKDPYELNKTQFNAAVSLLKKQKPLIKKYWALASDEIDLFKNGDAWIGATWPLTTATLEEAKAPVKDLIPKEGATGWLDTWMVSAHTKNLDCAYKWLAWISTPKVQAQQAVSYQETPVNSKACPIMNKLSAGSCVKYHANAPLKYFKQIYFWKTPVADCGNGKKDCMDYTKWPPVGAFAAVYVAALVALFVSAFWTVDVFTSQTIHTWTWANFSQLWHGGTYRTVTFRTIGIAAAVTLTDALIAFPFAYFMARLAGPRLRAVLFILVTLPLWASYLARVYAWRLILNNDGLLNWTLDKLGLPPAGIAYTNTAMWIVFSYIWLPFMIMPVYAALERIPHSYIEASRDLGAKGARTLRSVILPLALPGLVAGSIFTFSLTLGDFITPVLIGGPSSQFIGNVVYDSALGSSNLPFAAAFAVVPVVVMGAYLLIARRLGASEAL
jgi:putative spermidine/putrescine transport system substrate-binding protein